MKRLIYLFCFYILPCNAVLHHESENFQLIIEPKWQNLETNTQQSKTFGGKWVLVGSITFKKKAKEAVNLNQLCLHWVGEKLDDLLGSLYYKFPDKEFIPLEENLICDGTWNKSQQTLKLTFAQKHNLGLSNTFYLVLTIPDNVETLVKHGSFEIDQHVLPEPFRVATASQKLSLSLDAVDSTTSEINEQ